MKAAAVIPAHNEARFIEDSINGVRSTGLVDHVIVVDDCSIDATGERARDAGATVIRNETNRNYGGSIKRGYGEALELDPDVIVRLDADGQHNPENLGRFFEALNDPACQYVAGNRFADPRYPDAMPIDRRFGNRIVKWITSLRAGVQFTDPPCGYRAMDAGYLARTPYGQFSDDFRIGVEEVLAFLHLDAGFREVPVDCIYGEEDSSLSYFDGLKFLYPSVAWWNVTKTFSRPEVRDRSPPSEWGN